MADTDINSALEDKCERDVVGWLLLGGWDSYTLPNGKWNCTTTEQSGPLALYIGDKGWYAAWRNGWLVYKGEELYEALECLGVT